MSARSLKTTTALIAVLSLLQPMPASAQSLSGSDAGEGAEAGWDTMIGDTVLREFEDQCADAMILEAAACEMHILTLQAQETADDAATASADADANAEAAAEAEMQAQTDAEAAAEAAAIADEQAQEEANALADSAAEAASTATAEAEAAAQAAAEMEAEAEAAQIEAETAAQAEADAQEAADMQAEADAEAAAQMEADAQADADAEAAAQMEEDAQADADAEAAAQMEADAQAQADAEALADMEADMQAEADAQMEADAQADADAEAAAQLEADAQADADAEALADMQADMEADADAEAAAELDADAQADADAMADMEADMQADADAEAAAETDADAQADADAMADMEADMQAAADAEAGVLDEDCPAQVVGEDGSLICVAELTPEGLAASAVEADADAETGAEVTTETVTEDSRRSSTEEFAEFEQETETEAEVTAEAEQGDGTRAERDSGLSDLEKAGLFVLGAVVVGSLLNNGQRVEANTGDRVVVQDNRGTFRVLKDDNALLRQPGSEVRTERFDDGSSRMIVTREDGSRIVTIRDSSGRALRRTLIEPDGREFVLIDDIRSFAPVVVSELPSRVYDDFDYRAGMDRESLRLALLAADQRTLDRSFSLQQVREYIEVRRLAPEINIEALTFATNSAALTQAQSEQLLEMGVLIRELIAENPRELFLIEGHTDAVGDAGYNLLLSDRRAETVALALTEYFRVPAENLIVQGYGERYLRIQTEAAERLNRRVAVRRITPLLYQN